VHTRKRVYVAIASVALVGLGNVLAQSDAVMSDGAPSAIAQSGSFQRNGRAPRLRSHPPVVVVPKPVADFGDPLPNLTVAQLADFRDGLEDFLDEDTAASGLGPGFNNVSCVACHSAPTPGGASTILETRFGRLTNGHFDPLAESGGSLLQQSAIDPLVQEVVPPQANVVAKRLTTPLFGAGLIEAIPDVAIIRNATSAQPDGISGRLSIVQDLATGHTRIGRFGWKAQHASLLSFAADAYLNEVGITSRLLPGENAPNGNAALLAQYDLVADPEDAVDPATGKADIDHFADFMRLLAPPPQRALTSSAKAGNDVFAQIGCTGCHQPSMSTGPNSIRALDRVPVPLFSDLLLHDMGSLGDGIAQGTARPTEMRTAPLWGLRARSAFLHDGRAATVDAAIRLHDGEAARARDRFTRLGPTQQRQLLEFLASI
jgi:CxxC motif-containing protein (DUF1111 family)